MLTAVYFAARRRSARCGLLPLVITIIIVITTIIIVITIIVITTIIIVIIIIVITTIIIVIIITTMSIRTTFGIKDSTAMVKDLLFLLFEVLL